ncbi:MAG: hypothetical protein JNL95_04560 [Chitinophagales bacterium]|nr:hypothetical protein [Chitinophagales bacterium]
MQNKFLESFANYSNFELLIIINMPDDYQQEAIDAAAAIIDEREVTEDELKMVDDYILETETQKENGKKKIERSTEKLVAFFEPIIKPSADVSTHKWLNIFLFFTAIHYLWTFYTTVNVFILFVKCESCKIDTHIIAEMLYLMYIPILFYQLYIKSRLGWVLLLIDNALSIVFIVSNLFMVYKLNNEIRGYADNTLWLLFIKIAFVVFILKEEVHFYFNINPTEKKRYCKVIAMAAAVLQLLLFCKIVWG